MLRVFPLLLVFSLMALSLTGCNLSGPATTALPTASPKAETPAPPTVAPTPAPTATSAPTATPTPAVKLLPPEPQVVKFKAADGQELTGLYYPAAVNPAPVMVLMHYIGSDQTDWTEIAYWLQNRGLMGKTSYPQRLPWLDSSWFPPMAEGQSFAVFTFTYRGCGSEGCKTFDPPGWLQDSYAAIQTASTLEGVNPEQVLAAGASIGADGAVDACAWLNAQQGKAKCLGAFSLSPGSYLTVAYADAVKSLHGPTPHPPVWCLSGIEDTDSANTCNSAPVESPAYCMFFFKEWTHGMELIQPDMMPLDFACPGTSLEVLKKNVLQMMLDWIKASLELK